MKLEKIDLVNFKSFYGKCNINISPIGITSFIGPNGCGKSNIVDSIRWALGEQSAKSLRGNAMPELLFAGNNKYLPAKFCEVNLTFNNEDNSAGVKYKDISQISITRKFNSELGSEYLINNKKCRLIDIKELFMDSGIGSSKSYSIIEQGSIGTMILAKPKDRRIIIEEAAGIIKFNIKKIDAQKKLNDSNMNKARINDILSELKTQESLLRLQAEKSRRYIGKKNKTDRLENLINAKSWYETTKQIEENNQRLLKLETIEIENSKQFQILDNKIHNLKLELVKNEENLEEIRKKIEFKKTDHLKEINKIEILNQKIDGLKDWQKSGDEKQTQLKSNIYHFQQQKIDKTEKIESYNNQLNILNREEKKHRNTNQNLIESIKETEEKFLEINKKKISLVANQAKIDEKINNFDKTKLSLNENEINQEVFDWQKKRSILLNELNTKQNDVDICKEKLNEKLGGLKKIYEEKNQLTIQIKNLEEDIDNLSLKITIIENENIKISSTIDSWKNFKFGNKNFFTTVENNSSIAKSIGYIARLANLISISSESPIAIFKFFEENINLAVFQTINLQEKIVDLLKSEQVDNFKYLYIDQLQSKNQNPEKPKWIEFNKTIDQKLKNYIIELFGKPSNKNSLEMIIQSDNGINIYYNKEKVSQYKKYQQNILHQESLVQESISLKSEYNHKKNECEKVIQRLNKIKEEEKKLNDETVEINKEIAINEGLINQQKNKLNEYELIISKKKKQFELIGKEYIVQKKEHQEFKIKQQEIIAELKIIKTRLEENQTKINLLKIEKDDHQQLFEEFTIDKFKKESELNSIKKELSNIEQEIKNKTFEQQKVISNKHDFELKHTDLIEQQEKAKLAVIKINEKIKASQEEFDKCSQLLTTNREEYSQSMSQLPDKSAKWKQIQSEIEMLKFKNQAYKEDKKKIEDELFELKKLKPEEVIRTFEIDKFNYKEGVIELKKLKMELAIIDDVNLGAEKEHQAILKRLEFLENQYSDLEKSIKSLTEAIEEINQLTIKMFKETFYSINDQFSKLFPILFNGGEAKLVLSDENDLLQSGVDIIARPSGKRTQNLNLLSGGEKALTTIALVMAIFLYRPSPFCVLDEVDAPLDAVNVNRFGKLLKSLNTKTQFIIITHNPNSVELSDYVYGVTMEEAGISKIVSVNLNMKEGKQAI